MSKDMDLLIQAAVEGRLNDPGVLAILADRAARDVADEAERRKRKGAVASLGPQSMYRPERYDGCD